MNIGLELTVEHMAFIAKIKNLAYEGKELNKSTPKSEEELQEFIKNKKQWENKCIDYLRHSFEGDQSDYFADSFMESREFDFGYSLPIGQRAKNTKNDLTAKANVLEYFLRLLSISDAILNPAIVEEQDRLNWTMQQKKAILLEKLSRLNDGKYYDVGYIYWSCGIATNNHDEPRAIAMSLSDYGYIKTIGNARGISACITIDGIEALESMRAELPKSKPAGTSPDMEVINKKLDEVIEWLKRNDMGNEIIFDELQDLKKAGEKLDLKNWKQLLKGKLFDLGADKTIGLGLEGAKHIFKTLTGEDITKLLG
jgi:hypothetical protein